MQTGTATQVMPLDQMAARRIVMTMTVKSILALLKYALTEKTITATGA